MLGLDDDKISLLFAFVRRDTEFMLVFSEKLEQGFVCYVLCYVCCSADRVALRELERCE